MIKSLLAALLVLFAATAFAQSNIAYSFRHSATDNVRHSIDADGSVRSMKCLVRTSATERKCGAGTGFLAVSKNGRGILSDDSDAICNNLYAVGYALVTNHQWQAGFDTLKEFVERCPLNPSAHFAFMHLTGAYNQLGITPQRQAAYLAWLESVLYLNTVDPEYFCQCAEAIASAQPDPYPNTPEGTSKATNIGLAVLQWLIQNTPCDSELLRKEYTRARITQYDFWHNNPDDYVLDTTLPTMHDLGLDSLFGIYLRAHSGVPTIDQFDRYLANWHISVNPFAKSTTVIADLKQMTYITVEVFDVEGRIVDRKNGRTYAAGPLDIPIDLATSPAGTYYVRLELGTGDVRTLKAIKR